MSKDIRKNQKSSKFYSMNEFLQHLKKMSLNDDINQKTINTFNTISLDDDDFIKKEYKSPLIYKTENRNKLKEKLNLMTPSPNNYVNEVMKLELTNLTKENAELKFCINNLNKSFEKEIKYLKLKNSKKSKEIDSIKEIIKKNASLIELLGGKIINYEKIFKDIELKNKQNSLVDKKIKDKLLNAEKENEELKKDLNERDEIIKSFKDEIDSKKEIFEEIDKMKLDMEAYLKTMDKLYKEIEKKDKVISELKKKMDLIDKKHKEEIENITQSKNYNNLSNEELLNELKLSKAKQMQLSKELIDTQKYYNEEKKNNNKMEIFIKEANEMNKKSIDERDKMKAVYDKAIKELEDKYEKQIQIMKLVIVEQNEEFEKKLEELKKDKNIESDEDKDKEKEKEYLEKLKNDNKMLIKQNLELKNMNEMLLSKMKELPDLNNKFNELFETVKLLKEENDLLKKSMKNSKIYQMLNKEHEHEEEEEKEDENENEKEDNLNKGKEKLKINNKKINNKEIDNDNDENNDENPKLSVEELEMLENLINDVENNKGGDPETNQKKLEILENILKKLENKEEEHNEEEENEEEEKNNEDLNLKKQLLLQEMLKHLGEKEIDDENNEDKKDDDDDSKDKDNDLPSIINKKNNIKNDELLNNKNNNVKKPNEIYSKKVLKLSPKKNKDTSVKENKNNINEKDNHEKIKIEDNNEEEEENEEEESIPNQINENFSLYKPTKEGMLSFNLSKKKYSTVTPDKYNEFLKVFDPDTFLQYNTLEGLFIIPSNKSNQLYYYSSKKNVMNELFSFKENHSGGCLFLDNNSKNIFALGGEETKTVEKFSLETGQLDQLPELSTHRSKIACNQIGNIIYCFFGISKEKPNKSIVEYLDLDNIEEGWKEIDFENSANFNTISGMSCINLKDNNELLIIGGLLNDKIPNEKLLYFNIENKKLMELDKNLPDSDNKEYLFTQNTMFNMFVNGENTSFGNIDNNNQVHILDDELNYDLYLTPKIS